MEDISWAELKAFLTTPVVVKAEFSVLFLACSSREMTSPSCSLKRRKFNSHWKKKSEGKSALLVLIVVKSEKFEYFELDLQDQHGGVELRPTVYFSFGY